MSKTGDSKLSRTEFMNREMTRFSDIQKGYLKQFVAECIMNRFTTEESLLYLKDRLDVDLEEDEFDYLKVHVKKDLKRNMEYMRRHEFAYIQEYFDRIEETRLISRRLWKLVEDNPHNPILQKDCLSELCKSTIAMADFYQSIRELDQESATLKEEPEAVSTSSQETIPTSLEVEPSEAPEEEPEAISTSSQETIPTPPPELESGEGLKEEPEAISTSSQETIPTPPPELESGEGLKEEPEAISTSSQETIPTPPEVETPQKFSPKKIARYTSEGKPITDEG
jgi:hypothetical protein